MIGVFAAARYGLDTAGNVLVNTWLGGIPEGVLDLAVGAYLSISIPPILARWPLRSPGLQVTWQLAFPPPADAGAAPLTACACCCTLLSYLRMWLASPCCCSTLTARACRCTLPELACAAFGWQRCGLLAAGSGVCNDGFVVRI